MNLQLPLSAHLFDTLDIPENKSNTSPQPVREQQFWVYHRGQNRYHDST